MQKAKSATKTVVSHTEKTATDMELFLNESEAIAGLFEEPMYYLRSFGKLMSLALSNPESQFQLQDLDNDNLLLLHTAICDITEYVHRKQSGLDLL